MRSVMLLAVLTLAFSSQAQVVNFEDHSSELDFDRESFIWGGDGLAGAGWIDYDLDGDQDLYLSNGKTQFNVLYRNNGDGSWTDVTAAAGVAGDGTGSTMILVGDIDNDRYPDIFCSGDGGMMSIDGDSPTKFYHNNGDGTFTDITSSANVPGGFTTLGASFGDVDNDGFIDLFVTACGNLPGDIQDTNKLYLNNGDLTFTDISQGSGVDVAKGACVSFFSDYNDDGFIDLFVGNCNEVIDLDPMQLQLFRNNGDNTFTDVGAAAGLGLGLWMGLAPGDVDNDGDIDIFVTNVGNSFPGSPFGANTLYINNGDGTYTDWSDPLELDTLPWGWGTVAEDFDNDGYLDIYYNGSMPVPPFNVGCLDPTRLGNPGTFLFNKPEGGWEHHSTDISPEATTCRYTSGVASADFDNDGFVDLLTLTDAASSFDGDALLWKNEGNANNSICFCLSGTDANAMGIGARIIVDADTLTMTREVYSGSSFISTNSLCPTFGLGQNIQADAVRVIWPGSGAVVDYGVLPAGKCHRLNEDGSVGFSQQDLPVAQDISIYPNPGFGDSQLQFNTPESGEVVVTVRALEGRELSTLILGTLPQGQHSIKLEASSAWSTGTYMVTISFNGASSSVRWLHLKP